MIHIPVEPRITNYLHAKAARNHIPLSGAFELTPVCNMNCKMCYVRMTKEQQESVHPLRTAEEWIHLAEEARKSGMLYLLLTGGEPFMRSDFRQIMTALHKMGFIISINSNGTLIDEDTVDWLKEVPPVRINITLYGASDSTYKRLCNTSKGYTKAFKAINLLRNAGITVKINCSVTPYNSNDLEKIMQLAKQESLIIQPTAYMFPPLRRDSDMIGKNNRFSPEEAAYYSAKIEALLNGPDDYLERIKSKDLSLPSDIEDDCMEIEGEGIQCRAGKCSFWVTWDGHFLPCGMIPLTDSPNVFDVGFDAAWKYATEFSDAIRLPVKCKSCSIKEQCKACAAMVYTESGNFHTVPDYRCKMAHHYPVACKQIEAEILKAREEEH